MVVSEHSGPWREAQPKLQDPDPGQPGHDEVAEFVDQDQRNEDQKQSDNAADSRRKAGNTHVYDSAKLRTSASRLTS